MEQSKGISQAELSTSLKSSGVDLFDEIKSNEIVYNRPQQDCQSFAHVMDSLRCSETFTDITVCVNDEEFPCHRIVLASSSPYFKALFLHDAERSSTQKITLNDIPPRGFQYILQYMYTNTIIIDVENIIDILEVADFLQFRPIVEKCSSMLLQHINVSNCLAVHQIADSHMCRALATTAKQFILRNFDNICQSEEFLPISANSLLGYMKEEYVCVKSEVNLLESIIKWTNFDFERRKNDIWELCRFIDIHNIDKYVLKEIVSVDENIKALFKNVLKEREEIDDGSFTAKKSSFKRFEEVLTIIPRDTCKSASGKRKKDVLYFCTKDLKWKVLTSIPFNDRSAFDVALLNNEFYCTGGIEFNTGVNECEVYSVKYNDWARLTRMIHRRSNHCSAGLGNKLYVVGGQSYDRSTWGHRAITLRNDAEEFDPESRQWTMLEKPDTITGIGRPAMVALDDKLFVIGGTISGLDRNTAGTCHMGAMVYDINKKTWNTVDIADSLHDMKLVVGLGDCVAYEGCIFLIEDDSRGKPMAVLNPLTGKVHKFIRTHGQHKFGGYAVVGNTLYLTGGVASIFLTQDLVHCQDLTKPEGSWELLAPLPDPLSHHACISLFKRL